MARGRVRGVGVAYRLRGWARPRREWGRWFVRATVVATTLGLTVWIMGPVGAGAASVSPTVVVNVPDNVDCADLGYGGNELRVTSPTSATYDDTAGSGNPGGAGPLTVTLTLYPKKANQPKTSFDFTANMGVDAVIVRGGQNSLGQPISNWYAFDDPADAPPETDVTSNTKLTSRNANGKLPAIAQISFCYDSDETVTTSSSTASSTTDTGTTTTESTTTTTESTTTTTESTTTTTESTTTTTTDSTTTTTTDSTTTTTESTTTTTESTTTTTESATTTTDSSTTTTESTSTTTTSSGGGGGGGGNCAPVDFGPLVVVC
jgi:hypothetical protein